jgi:hypothetical protein
VNVHVRRPDGGEEVYAAAPGLHFRYEVRDDGRLVVIGKAEQAPDVRHAEYSRYGWHRVHRTSARLPRQPTTSPSETVTKSPAETVVDGDEPTRAAAGPAPG